jgi:hypothetical protein
MWRSRLRAAFLSNRDEVNAGNEPAITHKTSYDIYRLLPFRALFFQSVRLDRQALLQFLDFCEGKCELQMCLTMKRRNSSTPLVQSSFYIC